MLHWMIWCASQDLNLRRDVAMKIVLNPQAAKDAQIIRFVHEAQITGQLEHPSIVPVYELGDPPGEPAGIGSSSHAVPPATG